MRPVQLLLLSAATLAVAACNPFHRAPVTEVTTDANMNSRWRASLVTPAALVGAVQMNGTASMQPGRTPDQTAVSLNLANATPGGVHPWQVHRGQCGADEGVYGSPDSYRSVKIDDKGNARTTITLPMATPTTGSFFVTVSASAANAQTIVACGNLAPPTA